MLKNVSYYLYNAEGGMKNKLSLEEVKNNLNFLSNDGYVAIGINYESDTEDFPGSVDYINRVDTGEKYKISQDIQYSLSNNEEDKKELLKIASNLDDLLAVLN